MDSYWMLHVSILLYCLVLTSCHILLYLGPDPLECILKLCCYSLAIPDWLFSLACKIRYFAMEAYNAVDTEIKRHALLPLV